MGFLFELKNLLIVARYNEDISWVENLNCDVIIYNKGEELDPKYQAINIDNFGREAETYLRAICNLYEKIDELYDHVIFLQGNPFDHNPDILNFLPQDNNNLAYKYPYFLTKDNFRWVSLYFKQFGTSEFEVQNKYDKNNLNWLKMASSNEVYLDILRNTLNNLELPWYNSYICYPNAQFIIPKKYICAKPFEWWQNAYNLFDYCEKNAYKNTDYPGMAYIFEQLWYTIFTHF